MSTFWISWVEPAEDYRPVKYPPSPSILGWWCSGENSVGAILCAVVEAESEGAAKDAIEATDNWPHESKVIWRFCEKKTKSWKPGDRFPIDGWMTERFDEREALQ